VSPEVLTLTVWTVEEISPTQTITRGQILSQEIAAFEAAEPNVRLEFLLKKPHGKGGILDYLQTTGAVVPELLPDLVIIDVEELGAAVQAGLIQPLDSLIPPELVQDLYPFARQAATFDGQLYGLQFQADLEHMAYNTARLSIPPGSWPGVLSSSGPYLFPAGGRAGLVNDAFLTQYLAVRGEPAAGSPFLDEAAITAVLQFYQDGVTRDIIPARVIEYHNADETWEEFVAGEAAMAHVTAHRFLLDRGTALAAAPAPIPTIQGRGSPISHGWALALVTGDPGRQAAAVGFMTQWLSPQTNASWNLAAAYLPTRQAALANWDPEDSYTQFLGQQLEAARPRPVVNNYARAAAALQSAVEEILTGAATPEEAAARAIASTQ
jgi:multiple sugar transport system substrate-binding protein